MNKYIIVNKAAVQKRIEELEKEEVSEWSPGRRLWVDSAIKNLKEVLSQSTPLIPEIEKAFDEGKGVGIISYQPQGHTLDKELYNERKQNYISNLKLDI